MHRAELERLIATRSTQTNEVGRCTGLLPGLCHIAAQYEWHEPLSLLDLGTSAGLNLLFDDYAYTYRAAEGGAVRTAGTADSAVALECSVRDDLTHLPELRLPVMAERVGLDLSPVDPFSDDDALWLLGLPVARQPGALRAPARRTGQRARGGAPSSPRARRHGDGPAPRGRHHRPATGRSSCSTPGWPPTSSEEQQRVLAEQVPRSTRGRPVHHLYCETPFETPGLPTPPSPVPREGPDLATTLVHIGPRGRAACAPRRHPSARVLDPLVAELAQRRHGRLRPCVRAQ